MTRNEGIQMNYRQSDSCIVLMKVGNATGGKAAARDNIPRINHYCTQGQIIMEKCSGGENQVYTEAPRLLVQ